MEVEAVLRERLASLSLEQKARLLTGADFWSLHPEPAIGLLRRPDGGQGVQVRFLAADGSVRGHEDRATGAFTRLSSFGPELPMAEVAAIEVHTHLRPPETGTWLLGASGLGRLRLTVAGRVAFDADTKLPAGADPVEGMMRPPQQSVPVDLQAGEAVPVALHYEPRDTGGFDEAEPAVVTFQLNLARRTSDAEELERAVALAAEADVAVVVVGTTEEVEGEGFDRDALAMPGRQDELVGFAAATVGPGQEVTVELPVPARSLAHWDDETRAWAIEQGSFHLTVGRSYGDQRLATEIAGGAT